MVKLGFQRRKRWEKHLTTQVKRITATKWRRRRAKRQKLSDGAHAVKRQRRRLACKLRRRLACRLAAWRACSVVWQSSGAGRSRVAWARRRLGIWGRGAASRAERHAGLACGVTRSAGGAACGATLRCCKRCGAASLHTERRQRDTACRAAAAWHAERRAVAQHVVLAAAKNQTKTNHMTLKTHSLT